MCAKSGRDLHPHYYLMGGMFLVVTFEGVGTMRDMRLGCAVLCCGSLPLFYKHL